jgi:hypothetical protein
LESDDGGYTTPINLLSSDKDVETYKEDDSSAQLADEELDTTSYNSSVNKVDSGVFDANHAQRYSETIDFHQALWNKAGPTVGAMKVMLEMIRTEFEGELLGLGTEGRSDPFLPKSNRLSYHGVRGKSQQRDCLSRSSLGRYFPIGGAKQQG